MYRGKSNCEFSVLRAWTNFISFSRFGDFDYTVVTDAMVLQRRSPNEAHTFHSGTPQVGHLHPAARVMLSLKSSPLSSSMAAAFAFCASSVFFSRSEPKNVAKAAQKAAEKSLTEQTDAADGLSFHARERERVKPITNRRRGTKIHGGCCRSLARSGCNVSCLILTAASWPRVGE